MEAQLVDIFNLNNNTVVGGGLFLNSNTIITCAHVVNSALGRQKNDFSRPLESAYININFSFAPKCRKYFTANISIWNYSAANKRKTDYAILKITNSEEWNMLQDRQITCPVATCSDYWGNKSRIYGYPAGITGLWVEGKPLSRDGDGLLQVKTDSPIQEGFSGYPIFDEKLNGFTGIICGGISSTLSYAIPFELIMQDVPLDQAIVKKFNRKVHGVLRNIVRRDEYLDKIEEVLNEFSICIVTAASGFGKTTLCETYYREYEGIKKTFDQRIELTDIDLKNFNGLLYIDDYSENNIIRNTLEANNSFKILINCKSTSAALNILRGKGLYPWQNQIIITLNGFSKDEARYLMLTYGSEDNLSEYEIQRYIEFTKGCPMALKGLCMLLQAEQLDTSILNNNVFDAQKAFHTVMNEYLKINEFRKTVLAVLCSIPFRGMNLSALAFLLGESKQMISEALKDIVGLGYILEYQKNNKIFFSESVLVAHEMLKRMFENHFESSKELKRLYRKYNADYFEYISSQLPESIDIISKIDAFVCGIRGSFKIIWETDEFTENEWKQIHDQDVTWNQYSNELQRKARYQNNEQDYFFKKLDDVKQKAKNLFPENVNDALIKLIVEYFRTTIESADCSELIGLGQAFARLPVNKLLGDTIWKGLCNSDGWAKACCIRAAVLHSKKDNLIINNKRIAELKQWLCQQTTYASGPDFDLCAAVGGLLYLGEEEDVLGIITSVQYTNAIQITGLSDLAVLVYFAI
jgi:hypothetical protein